MTSLPNNSNNGSNSSNTQLSNQVLSANANNGNAGGGEQGNAIGPHVSATGSGLGSKAMMALCFILAVILIGYLASIAFKSLMPSYTPPSKSNDGSIYTATDTYQNKGMAKVEPNRTIIIKQGADNTPVQMPPVQQTQVSQQQPVQPEQTVPVDPNKGTILPNGTFVPDPAPVAAVETSAFEEMPPELARQIAGEEKKTPIPVVVEKEPVMVQVTEAQEKEEPQLSGALTSPMMGMLADNKNRKNSFGSESSGGREWADPDNNLNEKLMPAKIPAGTAGRIFNRHLTLAKGTFINCILETKIDTTVPGMTSCRIPENLYSMDGTTVLVEAGSRVFGEYRGSLAQGQDRVFVLWTQIHTPHGVVVNLDSPGTDALGGAGHEGEVDYHWWERFGNALLFSLIDDSFNFATMKASERSDGVSYYTTSQDSMSELIGEAMKQSGQIPPTIHLNQGARIGIFTARNIDMSSVYELKPVSN